MHHDDYNVLLRSLEKAGATHKVLISEEGGFFPDRSADEHGKAREPLPGYFQAICKCNWQDKTYYGYDHIRESAERHVFAAAEGIRLTPGGATIRPPNPKKRGKFRGHNR